MYPWPNDRFTAPDPSSPTGKRLAFRDEWMPRNRFGKPVSAAPYNFSDGFSPGNMIVTKVPGLDTPEAFARTGAVPITDIEHEVLLHVAFGDHQVANVSAEVEARTIGASVVWPALAPGRHTDVDPYFGIPRIEGYPSGGSALVVWDDGTPPPPITNTPPREGRDPHSAPRNSPAARRQKSEFLKVGGTVVDVCDGAPCVP